MSDEARQSFSIYFCCSDSICLWHVSVVQISYRGTSQWLLHLDSWRIFILSHPVRVITWPLGGRSGRRNHMSFPTLWGLFFPTIHQSVLTDVNWFDPPSASFIAEMSLSDVAKSKCSGCWRRKGPGRSCTKGGMNKKSIETGTLVKNFIVTKSFLVSVSLKTMNSCPLTQHPNSFSAKLCILRTHENSETYLCGWKVTNTVLDNKNLTGSAMSGDSTMCQLATITRGANKVNRVASA